MIRQATKKPITIEYIQYNRLNKDEIQAFVGKELIMELESETAYEAGVAPPTYSITIPTREGNMKAMPGDYIIKGVDGEFYPCKEKIFLKTYDLVFSLEEQAANMATELSATAP
jgi:hypothetical protein